MTLIVDEIQSEGGFTATTIYSTNIYADNVSSTTGLIINGPFSADSLTITTIPNNNNSNTEILSRNSLTGDIEYKDVSSFTSAGVTTGKLIGLTQIMYTF